MSDWTLELTRLVPLWKELHDQWRAWADDAEELPLSVEALAYFIPLTHRLFSEALDGAAGSWEVPRPEPREAWAHVLVYFHQKRPISGKYIMDDIFKAAREKAGKGSSWDQLDEFLGWVISQFKLRVREAVTNGYLKDFGPKTLRSITVPGEKKVGAGSDGEGEGRSLFDSLAGLEGFASEAERRELQALAEAWAAAFFPEVRQEFRLTLFLRMLRLERGIVIACTDKRVLSIAGCGKSVLSSGYDKTRKQWEDFEGSQIEWQESEPDARDFLDARGWWCVLDSSELWFWSEKKMEPLYQLVREHLR
jgi:hypothetical protein